MTTKTDTVIKSLAVEILLAFGTVEESVEHCRFVQREYRQLNEDNDPDEDTMAIIQNRITFYDDVIEHIES